MDPRVAAIRADSRIGRGTCSTIDECYTDEELITEMDKAGVTSVGGAVWMFVKREGVHNAVEDDVRGHGNVSPLHSPREPGRTYDDDPEPRETGWWL